MSQKYEPDQETINLIKEALIRTRIGLLHKELHEHRENLFSGTFQIVKICLESEIKFLRVLLEDNPLDSSPSSDISTPTRKE